MIECAATWCTPWSDLFESRFEANLADRARFVWLRAVSTAFRDTIEQAFAEGVELDAPWNWVRDASGEWGRA